MTSKRNGKSRRQDDSDSKALALPGSGLSGIFEEFMRPFDQFMEPFFQGSRSIWTELGGREPVVEFQDRGDHYSLTAELPGFERKDIEVRIGSDVLELKAEKSSEKETESDEGLQRQSSRSYFHRYLTLPAEVLSEKVDGTMKNGVLELRLPKREPKAEDKSRRVDLK